MSFADGKCPLCGSNMRVPKGQTHCYCPSCGEQILASAAIAFATEAKPTQKPPSQTDAISSIAPDGPGTDGARDSSSSTESSTAAPNVEVVAEKPFLDNWKRTPMGMAVLGFFLPAPTILMYLFVLTARNIFLKTSATAYMIAIIVIAVIFCIVAGIYALRIYPSLFTDNPKIESRGAVAYLNVAFGGIIFGSIWCSSLTKRRSGSSQVVFVVLLVVAFIASFVGGYIQGMMEASPSNSTSTAVSTVTNVDGKTETRSYRVIGFAEEDETQWSSATGTVSLSKSAINYSVKTDSKEYSATGTYYDTKDGIDTYQLNDGNAAAYGEENGVRYLAVASTSTLR